jgi:hypothetical protein
MVLVQIQIQVAIPIGLFELWIGLVRVFVVVASSLSAVLVFGLLLLPSLWPRHP